MTYNKCVAMYLLAETLCIFSFYAYFTVFEKKANTARRKTKQTKLIQKQE